MDSIRARRRIRHSGYATMAFAALQLASLPLPLHHAPDGVGWVGEWATVALVGASLLFAVTALRESVLAGAILGAYGAYRFALFGLAIVRVLDGTAASYRWGPAWVLSVAITLPFAAFWVRGGLAALAVRRDETSPVSAT